MSVKRVWIGVGLIIGVCLWVTGCGFAHGDEYEDTERANVTLAEEGDGARVLLLEELAEEAGSVEVDEGDVCCEGAWHFAFEGLTEAERGWYLDMSGTLQGMLEHQELEVEGLDGGLEEGDIDRIFQCVMGDHPEFFYVEGYTYTRFTRGDETVKLEFSGTYSVSEEEARKRSLVIDGEAEEIISGISMGASDYEKVKYVYETVIRNTEYDMTAPDNQNMYSVFAGHFSVCQGYAKAVQYLLNRLGVECTMVTGMVDTGEGHAWNLVKVDGEFYYVDATWGDASYMQVENFGSGILEFPEINYDYLCVNTEQLLRTHMLENVVDVPECTALENNYYVREGVYFREMDEKQLAVCFDRAAQIGKDDVSLKCADTTVYNEMYDRLVVKQGIFDYMDCQGGSIAYTQNEKQLSMTFWVTNG